MRIGRINPAAVRAVTELPAVRSQTRRVAAAIRDDARRRAPKKTGRLRKSIKVSSHRDPATKVRYYQVDVDAFYGRFVEMGTANQSPRPFLRPAADAYNRGDIQAKPPRQRG